MERNPFIREEQRLKDEHFPVSVFFNILEDYEFIKFMQMLSNREGFGYEFAACGFAEEEGETYEGVAFSLDNGEEVILTYEEFYYYMKLACRAFLERNPEKQAEIDAVLLRVKTMYGLKD